MLCIWKREIKSVSCFKIFAYIFYFLIKLIMNRAHFFQKNFSSRTGDIFY